MTEREKPDRDWKEYNEHLVQRGEILLAVESLRSWQWELQEMNRGKSSELPPQPDPVLRDTMGGFQPVKRCRT